MLFEHPVLLQANNVYFHALYPSRHLKWNCLCDLLNILEPVGVVIQYCTIILLSDVVSF